MGGEKGKEVANIIELFTIGFAGKSAERFFTLLMENGVRRGIFFAAGAISGKKMFAPGKSML